MVGTRDRSGKLHRAVVRDATPDDAGEIARIAKVAVPETYEGLIADAGVVRSIVEQSYELTSLRACVARCGSVEEGQFLVAELGGRVVAFLHYDRFGSEPELHRLYVDASNRRSGVGSALLAELHRRLDEGSSYVLMVVAANRPAVSFYRRHGLRELRRIDGVAHMREQMGVTFPAGTAEVPALILRYAKGGV